MDVIPLSMGLETAGPEARTLTTSSWTFACRNLSAKTAARTSKNAVGSRCAACESITSVEEKEISRTTMPTFTSPSCPSKRSATTR